MSNYSEHLTRVYFIQLMIENTPIYVNSSGVSLFWEDQEYLGVGALGEISGLGENTDMSAAQITLGLSGIPVDTITSLNDNAYQEKPVYVYQNDMEFSANGYSIINSQLIWAGRMDTADIEIGDTAMIQMRCESALAKWNRPNQRRMNDQFQQALYEGDLGLQYVAALADVSITL